MVILKEKISIKEWDSFKLDEVGLLSKGHGISKKDLSNGSIPCVRYGEIYTKHSFYIKLYYSFITKNIAKHSKKLKQGDILFASSGETLEEVGKAVAFLDNREVYAGGDIIIISPKGNRFNSMFLGFYFNSYLVRKKISRLGQGYPIAHIYPKNIQSIVLKFPTLKEQQKIAAILSTWDEAIDILEKLIKKMKNGIGG